MGIWLVHLNGIAFSRNGTRSYITNTGHYPSPVEATHLRTTPQFGSISPQLVRVIFPHTISSALRPEKLSPDERSIYQSLEASPDGLKVGSNGYLIAGSGLFRSADIFYEYGSKNITKYFIKKTVFAGLDFKSSYLVGTSGITNV